MPGLELVEQLSVEGEGERWLVRTPDGEPPRVAWLLSDEDPAYLALAADESCMWLGPMHPRVSQLHAIEWLDDALAFVIDDDSGPSLVAAAQHLADPIERERWTVAQLIALGDGLATMRQRAPDFVHRRLSSDRVLVDISGHARLPPPISRIAHGPHRSVTGRGRSLVSSAWWIESLSPEQCRGLPLTPASDVFSLAILLVQSLTGKNPFRRENDFTTLESIIRDPVPPLPLQTPSLSAVIARAFEKQPAARYPDPGTFAGELWRCIPDAADYDEVISDRIAAWRPTALQSRALFARPPGQCRLTWDRLHATETPTVRHCDSCNQRVIRVGALLGIVANGGRCVSYAGED